MDAQMRTVAENCLKASYDATMAFPDIVGTLIRFDTRLEGHVASVKRYHCRKFPMPARRMSAVFHPSFMLLSATIGRPRHTSVKWNAMMTFNFPDTLLDDDS